MFDVHIPPINQQQPKQISAEQLTKLLKSQLKLQQEFTESYTITLEVSLRKLYDRFWTDNAMFEYTDFWKESFDSSYDHLITRWDQKLSLPSQHARADDKWSTCKKRTVTAKLPIVGVSNVASADVCKVQELVESTEQTLRLKITTRQ